MRFPVLPGLFFLALIACRHFLALAACRYNDHDTQVLNQHDYLLFGSFYSECDGPDCVRLYQLTPDKLYEDVEDNAYYPEPFQYVELSNDKLEKVKDLPEHLPLSILTLMDSTIGCPDCRDQGGIFIRLARNGSYRSWWIDTEKDDIPAALHSLVDEVQEKIALINE